jgi:hypothetical protein
MRRKHYFTILINHGTEERGQNTGKESKIDRDRKEGMVDTNN